MWHLCEEIFRYLDLKTLLKCQMVSKLWNELLERLALVKYLYGFVDKVAEFHREVKGDTEEEVLILISEWNKAVQKHDKQTSIEDLRKLKCSLRDFDSSWRTHPVREAIRLGLADKLKINFRYSYDVTIIDGKIDLWWSNWGNHYKMAKWMLEFAEEIGTVDLNARDNRGRTPFQVACFHGNAEVVKLILDYSKDKRGIDLNAKDDYGRTALHLACKKRFGPNSRAKKTVQLILDFSKENDAIDLNARDNDGRTAFHCACEHNRCSEVAKCILDFSLENDAIDLNARDDRGMTALHQAISRGPLGTNIVKLILDFSRQHDGVDLNATDNDGYSPFYKACSIGKIEAVKLMLDFSKDSDKIDLNAIDERGRTGFLQACRDSDSCNCEIVQLILDFSKENDAIDLNARDNIGMTAFHLACKRVKIAKLILNFTKGNGKIDLNAKDKRKVTALRFASNKTTNFILQNWKEFGIDIKRHNYAGRTALDKLSGQKRKQHMVVLEEECSKIDTYEPSSKILKKE